jgi:hypothetical protein
VCRVIIKRRILRWINCHNWLIIRFDFWRSWFQILYLLPTTVTADYVFFVSPSRELPRLSLESNCNSFLPFSLCILPTNAQVRFIWHKLVYMFRPSMAIIRALHSKNTEFRRHIPTQPTQQRTEQNILTSNLEPLAWPHITRTFPMLFILTNWNSRYSNCVMPWWWPY